MLPNLSSDELRGCFNVWLPCFLVCLNFVLSALAARCLEVVTIHIPVFKAHFEERLPPKQYVLLSQFDQILKVSRRHVV